MVIYYCILYGQLIVVISIMQFSHFTLLLIHEYFFNTFFIENMGILIIILRKVV